MKIKVPTPKEYRKARRRKIFNIVGAFCAGVLFSAWAGSRVFRYGFDAVETSTWIILCIPL